MNSELKFPYSFEERRLLIQDGIFYLPNHFHDFTSFSFSGWGKIFKNDHPIIIEYCSGNGQWISQKAIEHPQFNWIAVEKQFDRAKKIWLNKKTHNIENLFIICGEGNTFTHQFIESNTIDEVYINFPDPWPKTKHAKHRIMSEIFKNQLHRILKNSGKVVIATDDLPYLNKSLALMNSAFFLKDLIENPSTYGNSYFSTLWQSKGRKIYYAEFSKR